MSTETILCVESIILKKHIKTNGFLPVSVIDPKIILKSEFAFFAPRKGIEYRDEFRQIIPYVILLYKDSVVVYKRTLRGSEHRLYNLSSIGLGGHVGLEDIIFHKHGVLNVEATVERAARREIGEEVKYAEITSKELVGVVFDDKDSVSRVHIGIVEIWDIKVPFVEPREDTISECRFVPIKEIPLDEEQFERWSYLCLSYLQNK